MIYLIIYLSIGFGVWVGLVAYRFHQHGFDYKTVKSELTIHIGSVILGFVGSLVAWPILIWFIEV